MADNITKNPFKSELPKTLPKRPEEMVSPSLVDQETLCLWLEEQRENLHRFKKTLPRGEEHKKILPRERLSSYDGSMEPGYYEVKSANAKPGNVKPATKEDPCTKYKKQDEKKEPSSEGVPVASNFVKSDGVSRA